MMMRCAAFALALSALAAMADDPAGSFRYSALPSSYPATASAASQRPADDWPSPFTNSACWTCDGVVPSELTKGAYYAGKINDAATVLWTPRQSSDTTYDLFSPLVLETGSTLCIRHDSGKVATFEELQIAGSPQIWCANVGVTILDGKVQIASGAQLDICSYNKRVFEVRSDLTGTGTIRFLSQNGTSAYAAPYRIYGNNAGFTGKVIFYDRGSAMAFSTLSFTNACNLGGTLAAFAYDALKLNNGPCKLCADGQDIVLSADANRGLHVVTGKGAIEVPVESRTLTVNWPITIGNNGRLYKDGVGRLVLGNSLRFMDKAKTPAYKGETPVSGCNYYIDIREGTVAATHCNALNGAKVAFSNDTALAVCVNPSDSDLRTYGVRFDKISAPLATDVPIVLEAPEEGLADSTYSVSLLTVKSTDAEDVSGKISVTFRVRGYKLAGIEPVPDTSANTVTFKAQVLQRGTRIVIR